MPTRAELRERGDISPELVDDVFELAARLQVADRARDPARRPMGESRAADERLVVSEHFVTEARERVLRRTTAWRISPLGAQPAVSWRRVLRIVAPVFAVSMLTLLVIGWFQVTSASSRALQQEAALVDVLQQQLAIVEPVMHEAPSVRATLVQLHTEARNQQDVTDLLVAVSALGRELSGGLEREPSGRSEQELTKRKRLVNDIRRGQEQVDVSARLWRDANLEWTVAAETLVGRLVVGLGLARGPRGAASKPMLLQ